MRFSCRHYLTARFVRQDCFIRRLRWHHCFVALLVVEQQRRVPVNCAQLFLECWMRYELQLTQNSTVAPLRSQNNTTSLAILPFCRPSTSLPPPSSLVLFSPPYLVHLPFLLASSIAQFCDVSFFSKPAEPCANVITFFLCVCDGVADQVVTNCSAVSCTNL